jgi:hypothetical protein
LLPVLEYPPNIPDRVKAMYEMACDGLPTAYVGKAMQTTGNEVENELRKIREKWHKFDRPNNVFDVWCRVVGIAAILSVNERAMLRDPKTKSREAAIDRIARSIGRGTIYVESMIYLFRNVVLDPVRSELGG